MTGDARISITRGLALAAAVGLLLAGAGAAYVGLQFRPATGAPSPAEPPGAAPPAAAARTPESGHGEPDADAPLPGVTVTLDRNALERAGIVVAPVTRGSSALELRLPGVVEPNAYREVAVTPIVGGRVTRVSAELGERVRGGETLAEVYSPSLAEAQGRYVSARALLQARDRELRRTERLAAIGSASQQELERIRADQAAQSATLEAVRAELELLGVPAATIEALDNGMTVGATSTVPAPFDGVVTERVANVGLNVDPATRLFTVTDLSTVWVVADLYERDFGRVQVGSEAVATTPAYPDLALRGRISYIDPQVDPATRTARVRLEVPNPRGVLRLGMYADVTITAQTRSGVTLVPRGAVQNVGTRTVVYLAQASEPGTFVEREVRLGSVSGDQIEVTAGVQPGDLIVVEGSFSIRAERERLGLRPGAGTNPGGAGPPTPAAPARSSAAEGDRAAAIAIGVTGRGFEPAEVSVEAGRPARLVFTRTTDQTCATEVIFPSLGVRRALPLNQPVTVEFMPERSGRVEFACGMNMFKGSAVVRAEP